MQTLTETQVKFLKHVSENAGREPELTGATSIAKVNHQKTKAILLEGGYLTPAKRNRVIISNKGISALQAIEAAANTPEK